MTWHIIQGEEGCRHAVDHGCVAIVVDALRASATAAMLLDGGATEILAVPGVEDARRAKDVWPDALLAGERNAVPPGGFDYGNSPRDAHHAKGRRVIFTTTTGSGVLMTAWGAEAVYMGTTLNAHAVANVALRHETDVVLIPAGLAGDPSYSAQEDWVAATIIAMEAEADLDDGCQQYSFWRERIENEGVLRLFETSPHAENLRNTGQEEDIPFCAQVNHTTAVPAAVSANELGVTLRNVADGPDL